MASVNPQKIRAALQADYDQVGHELNMLNAANVRRQSLAKLSVRLENLKVALAEEQGRPNPDVTRLKNIKEAISNIQMTLQLAARAR